MRLKTRPAFPLGRIVSTAHALEVLDQQSVVASLDRHGQCDWGDVDEEDGGLNELALLDEGRLLSVYHDSKGVKFWIITEWDRSATTILLPDEY